MADETIRRDFLDGVQEVFTTLFNEGVGEDGILYFPYLSGDDNPYQEHKFKRYSKPLTFVSNVDEQMTDGSTPEGVDAQKRKAVFTVPTKCLTERGITSMDKATVSLLRKGLIRYDDVFYMIDKVQGKTFVENTYLMWEFYGTEVIDPDRIQVEIEEEPELFKLALKEE